ncbi:glutamate-rich WD repeat-containing protein 1-like [Agrilus planipennis]|uniref:Glutamate-rich WD repeat-containing protein 1-like n=1 Tax=Agrilus planipennis TaxID=224129 RepID=A0A7F5R340_AGRPL|nr:glutamate-rich WD repeat-containing protein 1-like [Agrilus planipennis]
MSGNEMELEESHTMENDNAMHEGDDENKESIEAKEVYLPGKPLKEGDELVCDETAYIMLYQAQTGAHLELKHLRLTSTVS